ncbi:hypothetical protein L873DRAFT_1812688 [Choiromyces venosus 120613-1]|uniref:DUF7598 domain-containing protein n=1 Tax=Choiromyces venosus 120613-1 TaxID=1336337 RepID=A0A3N4JNW1_9PEZI|nr:hypothetical protein L873DRAFT_1812688 [Choiromyces venosus 120613-1]
MREPVPRGFYILNIIRCCSVISLLMAIVAAGISLVKSFVVTKFYFFDAINNVFLSIFCVLLVMSEISVFPAYFDKRWPLLGSKSSLITIGISEVIVGFFLLGNLNETAASKQNLGYSFNTLLTSAGIIVSFIGVVNFIASYAYGDSMTHTTARMARSRRLMKAREKERQQTQYQPSFNPAVADDNRSIPITMPARSYSARSRASNRSQETMVTRTASTRSTRPTYAEQPAYSISSWYSRPSETDHVAKEFV